MKITRAELKEIILQEFADRSSPILNPVATLNDYETKIFDNYVNAVTANLAQLEKVLREDETLDRKDFVYFKEKVLDDVYQSVAFVESAIDDRLKTKNED